MSDHEPRRRPSGRFLVTLTMAVIVASGAVVYFLAFGGGPERAGQPREAVRLLYGAIRDGDCRQAAAAIDREGRGDALHEREVCDGFADLRKTFGKLVTIKSVNDESARSAVVLATVEVDGVREDWIFRAQRRSADWRLSGGGRCLAPRKPQDLGTVRLSAGERPARNTYSSNPPTSGPAPAEGAELGKIYPANPGLPELVRAMEQGAVVLWHQGLDQSQLDLLEKVATRMFGEGYRSLIVTPHDDLKVPVAATAWGVVLECGSASDEDLQEFVDTNYARGPEGQFACEQARLLADVTPLPCETS